MNPIFLGFNRQHEGKEVSPRNPGFLDHYQILIPYVRLVKKSFTNQEKADIISEFTKELVFFVFVFVVDRNLDCLSES